MNNSQIALIITTTTLSYLLTKVAGLSLDVPTAQENAEESVEYLDVQRAYEGTLLFKN